MKTVLQWLAERRYNRFDPIWLIIAALAIRDHEWFAMVCIATTGALLSVAIERIAESTTT